MQHVDFFRGTYGTYGNYGTTCLPMNRFRMFRIMHSGFNREKSDHQRFKGKDVHGDWGLR